MSREHDGADASIPLPLVELLGSVEAAFELCTDEDRSMIVYYDESLATLYTADGDFWDEDVVYLLPGQQTDLRSFVCHVVDPTRTALVTRFRLADYMVEWECLTVGTERVGADEFDVYRGGNHLMCVHMRREVNEDALLTIAARIAPNRPLGEIMGTVS